MAASDLTLNINLDTSHAKALLQAGALQGALVTLLGILDERGESKARQEDLCIALVNYVADIIESAIEIQS